MAHYKHLSYAERKVIGYCRNLKLSMRATAQMINRSVSTVSREIKRNLYTNGGYKSFHAQSNYQARVKRCRRGTNFSKSEWVQVLDLLAKQYSPEQISGRLKLEGKLHISHETIYSYIWQDKKSGGELYKELRGSRKLRRKRHNSQDSRGRLVGKKMIDTRPDEIEKRLKVGHWEIDTVHGKGGKSAIVTLVERATGYVMIGQLDSRKVIDLNSRTSKLINRKSEHFKTITADNGVEFHGYKKLEKRHDLSVYFAYPYHSWQRGTNENTNGLIRQYLPKGLSMEKLTQIECNSIARKLNNRPRKRYGYQTPLEMLEKLTSVALPA